MNDHVRLHRLIDQTYAKEGDIRLEGLRRVRKLAKALIDLETVRVDVQRTGGVADSLPAFGSERGVIRFPLTADPAFADFPIGSDAHLALARFLDQADTKVAHQMTRENIRAWIEHLSELIKEQP